MGEVLAYVAAGILLVWGTAHLVPTKKVVSGFGVIGPENRQILRMEWIAESVAFGFVALLVLATTLLDLDSGAAALNYRMSAGFLVGIGILTAMTAAKNEVIWFKACPVVMCVTALLLVIASFV